uniref:Uncharacterized protein n=1 Tax=Ditylenchus dipsaci TaxID=166011 RepID=A0A915EDF7_9BILA
MKSSGQLLQSNSPVVKAAAKLRKSILQSRARANQSSKAQSSSRVSQLMQCAKQMQSNKPADQCARSRAQFRQAPSPPISQGFGSSNYDRPVKSFLCGSAQLYLSSHAQAPVKAIAPAISAKRLAKQAINLQSYGKWKRYLQQVSPVSVVQSKPKLQFRDPLLKRL